jgi:hypothetical protein
MHVSDDRRYIKQVVAWVHRASASPSAAVRAERRRGVCECYGGAVSSMVDAMHAPYRLHDRVLVLVWMHDGVVMMSNLTRSDFLIFHGQWLVASYRLCICDTLMHFYARRHALCLKTAGFTLRVSSFEAACRCVL